MPPRDDDIDLFLTPPEPASERVDEPLDDDLASACFLLATLLVGVPVAIAVIGVALWKG